MGHQKGYRQICKNGMILSLKQFIYESNYRMSKSLLCLRPTIDMMSPDRDAPLMVSVLGMRIGLDRIRLVFMCISLISMRYWWHIVPAYFNRSGSFLTVINS